MSQICKLLHRTTDMGACLSFEHITEQLPEPVSDIIWVIKRMKDALVWSHHACYHFGILWLRRVIFGSHCPISAESCTSLSLHPPPLPRRPRLPPLRLPVQYDPLLPCLIISHVWSTLSRVPLGAAPSYRARVWRLDINHLQEALRVTGALSCPCFIRGPAQGKRSFCQAFTVE